MADDHRISKPTPNAWTLELQSRGLYDRIVQIASALRAIPPTRQVITGVLAVAAIQARARGIDAAQWVVLCARVWDQTAGVELATVEEVRRARAQG